MTATIPTFETEHHRAGRFLPANAAYLAIVHLVALAAPWTYSRAGLWCFLGLSFATHVLGEIIGYHRLLAHRSFRAKRPIHCALALLGTLAGHLGPIRLVALHRHHHAHSDTARDVHSPREGIWWAYAAWLWHEDEVDDDRLARDAIADPFLRFLERRRVVLLLLSIVLLAAVGWMLGGSSLAMSLVVWGYFLRVAVTIQPTFLLNVLCHSRQHARPERSDGSRNVAWLVLPTFGESWHRNHHEDPHCARTGIRPWEFDPAYLLIVALERLGLASHVRHVRADSASGADRPVTP
jgi:stearoyl-CoA desaturase (delta-9 desaturase)